MITHSEGKAHADNLRVSPHLVGLRPCNRVGQSARHVHTAVNEAAFNICHQVFDDMEATQLETDAAAEVAAAFKKRRPIDKEVIDILMRYQGRQVAQNRYGR